MPWCFESEFQKLYIIFLNQKFHIFLKMSKGIFIYLNEVNWTNCANSISHYIEEK